jgi:hydroxyethylthiazole kinase
MSKKMYESLRKIRGRKPLIHHITNIVVSNLTANFTLAMGALPIMANAREEVKEIVDKADVLLLNIGTLTKEQLEAMLVAGQHARKKGKKIVFDPVGTGASNLRTEASFEIMKRVKPNIVRGNYAEICKIAGEDAKIRGVESAEGDFSKACEIVKKVANRYGCVTAISGKVDLISDGKKMARTFGGNEMLKTITGSGCMATTAIGCFASVESDFEAAIHGLELMRICSETAASSGPATFQNSFLDAVFNLSREAFEKEREEKKEREEREKEWEEGGRVEFL